MPTNKFVTKMVAKCLILVILVFVVAIFSKSTPVISNELALAQMENSNERFMTWSLYKPIISTVRIILSIICGCMIYNIIRDIHKFVKTINTKNEKEN